MIMAASADGRIAKDANHYAGWTSREDKQSFIAETKKHKAIIMGSTTFNTIGKALPGRLNLILTSSPEKYANKKQEGVLEFFKGSAQAAVDYLKSKNYTSATLGGGAKTNAEFIKANLVDEILLTIEPKLFGKGINIIEDADLDVNLELLEITKLSNNVIQLKYKVIK